MTDRPATPICAPSLASADPTPPADPRWGEWYEAHGRAVYGFIRFHVESPDEAEDLAADTFLRAFRSAERFDPTRASAKTWILSIARNAVRDHQRSARVRRRLPLASLRDLASDHPSPEERLLWEEQVWHVLAAVGRLPAGDREILSLRYGSELEPAGIAAALGIRESTARTRLWRALGRLRAEVVG